MRGLRKLVGVVVVVAMVLAGAGVAAATPFSTTFSVTGSPTQVVAGSVQTFSFTFVALRPVNKGEVSVTVPDGWTAPQAGASGQPGYVAIAASSCQAGPVVVTGSGPWSLGASGIKCRSGETLTVTYNGARTLAGTYDFVSSVKASPSDPLAPVKPPSVTVVAGPADHGVFSQQPTDVVAGEPVAPAVTVSVFDRWGNAVADGTPVAVSVHAGPAGAALAGTTSVATTGNLATFPDLSMNKAGRYSFDAAAGSVALATSAGFAVSHAVSSTFTLALAPDSLAADGVSTATATVSVTDRFGNPVAGDPVAVSTDGDAPVGSVADHGDGTYSAVVTASHTVGSETVTATDGSWVATHVLTETHGPAAAISLSSPSPLSANGTDATSVVASVRDQWGNAVDGAAVTITTNGDSHVGAVVDHGDGTYSAAITASTTADRETITASLGSLTPASATLVEAPVGCPLAEYVSGGSAYVFAGTGATDVGLELTPANGAPAFTLSTGQSVIGTTSAFNEGWWSPNLPNSSDNDNYLAGVFNFGSSVCMHAFFTFDLTGVGGGIASARLVVGDTGFGDGRSAMRLDLWDVTTPATTLNRTVGTSLAIYNDLGSGVGYGSYAVDPAAMPTTYELNASAVNAINSATGYFSIGASLND